MMDPGQFFSMHECFVLTNWIALKYFPVKDNCGFIVYIYLWFYINNFNNMYGVYSIVRILLRERSGKFALSLGCGRPSSDPGTA